LEIEGEINPMTNIKRADIKIGAQVRIALKKDQRTNKLTEGVVKEILTKSTAHLHGVKVRLENGQVGRVKELVKN
jgi:uncharacterized repeat protein (TIGR03833 family)